MTHATTHTDYEKHRYTARNKIGGGGGGGGEKEGGKLPSYRLTPAQPCGPGWLVQLQR